MKSVIVCSGGSGGHVFPAIALCDLLKAEGYDVVFLTDKRGYRFCSNIDFKVKIMPKISSTPSEILKTVWNAFKIFIGLKLSWRKKKPDLVIGFGGVMTILPLITAKNCGIKTIIHEQNMVFGKANKLLERFADFVTVSFADNNEKHIHVESPVRSRVFEKFAATYNFKDKKKFVISVLGGSQTADIFASVVPLAFKFLQAGDCKHIKVIQQVSENRMDEVKSVYDSLGIECDLRPFINDIENVFAESSLVISRAGASTLAELGTIGRPAILVPYPYAGDHQKYNAEYFENLGAAWVIYEKNFSPKNLALKLEGLLYNTDQLVIAAVNMLKSRKPSSNKRFVEFCKKIIGEA